MAGFLEGDQVYLHNGLRVPVAGPGAYYGPFSQLLVINRGVHEPLEEFVFQEVLKRLPDDPSMIELGAYWGHYSTWLKQERPEGQVILVEPEAEYLKAGQDNFVRNGFQGVHQGVRRQGQVRDRRFFQDQEIKKLDILHTDIQGFEVEMLQGTQDVLTRRRVQYLFISTHSQQIHGEVVGQVTGLGYRVEISSDFDLQTTSFDGFVFASSPEVDPVFGDIAILGREEIAQRRPADILKSLALLRGVALVS
jgi:hypothetical protein